MMHCCALLLLLCLSPVASLQLGGVLGRNGLLRTTPGPALRSCTPPRMQQRWGPVDVTLSKPLGLVLEEFGSGGTSGVVVVSLVEGGAAEESGDDQLPAHLEAAAAVAVRPGVSRLRSSHGRLA